MFKVLFRTYPIEIFVILLLSIIEFTPFMQNNISPPVKMLVFVSGVGYLFYKTRRPYNHMVKSFVFYGSIFMLIIALYVLLHISNGKITTLLFPQILITVPIVLFAWVPSRLSPKQTKYLFHCILIIFTLNILDSIRLSILYPVLTYQIALGLLEEEGISGLNLGGSSFLTCCVLFVNIVFFSFSQTKSKSERMLFLIYMVIALLFLIFYSYKASVIVLALISVVLQYFVLSLRKASLKRLFALILILLIAVFVEDILYYLTYIIGSERVSNRILFLINSEYGDDSSFNSRYELWGVSIQSWLKSIESFFFGIGDHPKVNGDTALSGIGRHSDILDTLARYGIMGFFFIYMMFARFFKYLKAICCRIYNSEINMIIVVVAIISLTKRILYPDLGFITFFLLPLCIWCNYVNRSQKNLK